MGSAQQQILREATMAGFPDQIHGMKPWFGKRYHFEPKGDITAFELAQILLLVSKQAGPVSIATWIDLPDGIPAPFDRHFAVMEY